MRNQFKTLLVSLLICLAALSGPAVAQDRYIAAILGTRHVGNDSLNDRNIGLTFGKRWPSTRPDITYFREAGIFHNSYHEISPILVYGVSKSIGKIGRVEFHVGASAGTAYYKELSVELKDRYGVPNLGGFIPIVALSASARIGASEIRLTTVPPDIDTKAVLNLSIAHSF